jgi:hypothetical protein
MLKHCVTVNIVLLAICLVSRGYVETKESRTDALCVRLVSKAMHWRNVSGSGPLARHKHLAMSLAFLLAAREVAPDALLEQLTSVDVSQMRDALERDLRSVETKTQNESFNADPPRDGGKKVAADAAPGV